MGNPKPLPREKDGLWLTEDNKLIMMHGNINANNHKVRNVADGAISKDSTDAVNGHQLFDTRHELTQDINSVGAQSAAMANLHPLEYNEDDKVSVSASVGAYKNKTAGAFGAYYCPDEQSMISVASAIGSNDNMYSIGFSKKFGKEKKKTGVLDEATKIYLTQIENRMAALETYAYTLQYNDERIAELERRNAILEEKIASYGKLNSAMVSLSKIQQAYELAQAEVRNLSLNIFSETVDIVESDE